MEHRWSVSCNSRLLTYIEVRRMEKTRFPRHTKYSFIAAVILLIFYGITAFMKSRQLYLYIFRANSEEIMPILMFAAVVLLISGGAVWAYNNIGHKIIITICVAILTGVVSAVFLLKLCRAADNMYFEFYSDDREHHIVVKEKSFLLAGYGDIYEVIAPGVMSPIGEYTTDDGYRPFSDNKFSFEWHKDGCTLTYYYGAGTYLENGGYETVDMHYAD